MPPPKQPRRGSLQFYPRKRAARFLPSPNWKTISTKEKGLLGFIAYKVGMSTAVVKDNTDKSMTAKKQIFIPVTILEIPPMKIYSVRFYNQNQVVKEIVVSNDKELKRRIKTAKQPQSLDKLPENYDDIRILVYSMPKQTSIKKVPDMVEIAISEENKLEFVKSLIGKEITPSLFAKSDLLDVRGLTKGKGTQGVIKRFGARLRFHKTEKGQRKVGSIGPWHPARVTFKAPMAGQMGLFTRVIYNSKIISQGSIKEKDINPKQGFKNYGMIRTNYILLNGSVQGPAKRQLLLTTSFRPSKEQSKKKFEFLEILS